MRGSWAAESVESRWLRARFGPSVSLACLEQVYVLCRICQEVFRTDFLICGASCYVHANRYAAAVPAGAGRAARAGAAGRRRMECSAARAGSASSGTSGVAGRWHCRPLSRTLACCRVKRWRWSGCAWGRARRDPGGGTHGNGGSHCGSRRSVAGGDQAAAFDLRWVLRFFFRFAFGAGAGVQPGGGAGSLVAGGATHAPSTHW